MLVVDETGDVKKGAHTVRVKRQYTGTARRIENAQVAVYLVYAGPEGHTAVDRELHIPRPWTCDADRCRAADCTSGRWRSGRASERRGGLPWRAVRASSA